jgi:O-antigen/teichoic acid export membrane protein
MTTLFRNASWSGAAAAFRAASGLINALLAIRLLGVGDYGHVATVLSLFVLYLSLNASIFTALVVKLMSPRASDAGEDSSVMLAAASIFTVVSIVLLVIVTLLLREFAPRFISIEPGNVFTAEIRRVILLMGVLTAVQIVVALHSALIESAGRLDLSMKWQLIGPTVVLTVLAFSFFARLPISASGYVAALCGGAATDLCLLWFVKRNVIPFSLLVWPSRNRLGGLVHLLKSGGVLQATSLMSMFLEPLNKLLLNYFVGAAAVTIYDLAMKVIWGIQYLFGAAMRVFLHLGSQEEEAVGRTFSRVIALVGVPVVILHAIGALFLSWAAHHWLIIDAAQLMVFFTIATVSNLGMIYVTPLYISLIGRGDLHFIFRSHVILAGTNAVVSLALIPYMGLIGAAFGLLSATIYNVGAIYVRCKDNSGTFDGLRNTLRGWGVRYVLAVVLFAVAIVLGIKGGNGFIGSFGVLLGLAAILVWEPLPSIVFQRIRIGE